MNSELNGKAGMDDDADKDASYYCCKLQYYLELISDGVNRGIRRVLFKLGQFVGRHPVWVLVACCLFAAAFAPGIALFFEHKSLTDMNVPTNSHLNEYFKFVEKYFKSASAPYTVIVTADNVLQPSALQDMVQIDKKIRALKGDNYEWDDVCYKLVNKCWVLGILEVWNYNETIINDLSQEQILEDVNTITHSPVYGGMEMNLGDYLGDIKTNSSNYIVAAGAARIEYLVKSTVESGVMHEAVGAFEKDFIDLLSSTKVSNSALQDVFYNSEHSVYESTKASSNEDLVLLGIGYIIIAIFACLYIGRLSCVKNRIFVGIGGVICVGFSLVVTLGMSAYAGYAFSDVHTTLPFLLFGIMVDNMFVLSGTLSMVCEEDHGSNVETQIGHTLAHGGLSIMVTSFTDILALGIGATTTLPFIKSFCVHITIGIFGNFVFVMTFYAACLALDQHRSQQNRNGFVCCIVHKDRDSKDVHYCRRENHTRNFIDKYYAPFLSHTPVKVIIILITLSMLGVFCYGWSKLEYDTDDKWRVEQDGYTFKYLTVQEEHFKEEGVKVAVFLGHNVDYYKDWEILRELCHEIEHDKYTRHENFHCWPEEYRSWLNETQVYNNYSSQLDPLTRFPTSEYNYYDLLGPFLNQSANQLDRELIVFNHDNKHIAASKIVLVNIAMDSPTEEIEAMEKLEHIVHETGYSSHDCFAFTFEYFKYELNKHMGEELDFSIALASGCVVAMSLLLLASPIMALYMGLCISIVLLDVKGAMYFWDMTIDAASAVMVIQALGFTVDYCVHMSESFMSHGGSRSGRTRNSLKNMGPAVWYGGLATFAVLLPVYAAKSYIFRTFYKVFLLVWVFGLFHGLVFLPVLLSWIGPRAYMSVEKDHRKHHEEEKSITENPPRNGQAPPTGQTNKAVVVDDPDNSTVFSGGEFITQF